MYYKMLLIISITTAYAIKYNSTMEIACVKF